MQKSFTIIFILLAAFAGSLGVSFNAMAEIPKQLPESASKKASKDSASKGALSKDVQQPATPENKQEKTLKIAVVNVQSVLENSTAMIGIKEDIEKISKNFHDKYVKRQASFHDEEQAIMAMKDKLAPEQFEEEAAKFNAKITKSQNDIQSERLQLEEAQASAIREVNEIAMQIIEKISLAQKIDVILPSSQLLYATPELNITQDVLDMLNATAPSVKIKL